MRRRGRPRRLALPPARLLPRLIVPVLYLLLLLFLSVDGVEGAFHGYDACLRTGLTMRWGERVQSMMLTHMLLYNLTPHTACNMQNGAPVHVAKSTLRH